MKIIGITGGIGSGKSTVAKVFNFYDVPVFTADTEGKIISDCNPIAVESIKKLFGNDIYVDGNGNTIQNRKDQQLHTVSVTFGTDLDSYNDGEKWHAEISGLEMVNSSNDVISFDVVFTDELTGYESDYYKERWQERHSTEDEQDTGTQQEQSQPRSGEGSENQTDSRNGDSEDDSGGGCGVMTFPAFLALLVFGIPRIRK